MVDNILDFLGVESKSKARNRSFFLFLGGVVVGAAAGMLFAPQSGEETREKIKDTAVTGADKTVELSKKAAKEIKEKYEEIKQKVKKAEDIIEENVEDTVEDLEEV
ncbi:MAG: YtxH domain-containing protein [Eubacteriales bacterium]|nr:YtxH domain-containing protein [Eubacteriales bacterium]